MEFNDELLLEAIDTLRELALDVEAYVTVEYPDDLREQYPMYQRKYDRDMSLPRYGRFIADALEHRFRDAGDE